MALDKCNDAIGAAIGRELTDREKRIVLSRATELKSKIDRAANDPLAVDKVLKEFSDTVQADAALRKRSTALNYRAFASLKSWRQSVDFVAKNPGEGVVALFRGSLRNFQGAKDSIANIVQRESSGRREALLADLVKANLKDYAFSGTDDKNITRAWADLKDGRVPNPSKYGANAVKAAQIFDNHLELMRQDQNQAGAFIGRAADRLWRRSHDAIKIARAGGNSFGSEASKAWWTDFVSRRLNWDKAFDGNYANASENVRKTVLGNIWSDFASNNHMKLGKPTPPVGLGSANLGKKLSHGRELIFNSPDDEISYFQTFGHGNSVAENVIHNLTGGGRDLALMRRLGPNPEATLHKWAQDWQAHLRENGTVAQRKAFDKAFEGEMGNTWRLLTEGTGHPEDNFVARTLATVRQVTNTAALGMSVFALPGDLALRASQVARVSGESFYKTLASQAARQAFGHGLSKAEAAQLFAELGLRTENAHLPLDPFLVDHVGFGNIAKFNQHVMSVTGHSWWDNRFRLNALVADGYRHWTLRDTKFADLHPDFQAALQQFSIDKKGWDILRSSKGTEISNGMRVFMPSDIAKMDVGKFKSLVDSATPTDSQLTRARNILFENYRNFMGELADRGTSSPSIANRAFMGLGNKGVDTGTVRGELYRGALQLKGWGINYMRNQLGAELYGRDTEMLTFGQAMAKMLKGQNPKGLMGLAQLISAGVVIASVTNMLKDLATGKTPEDPSSQHAILRAFARQSLGIYSDFLFQDVRPDASFWDRVGRMTGPEFGLLSDAVNESYKLANQINSEEGLTDEKLSKDYESWFQDTYRRVPGTNLFWNKWAMDYMILNNISESLNPGYQQRLIDRANKNGQTYLVAPGPQTTP